MTSVLCAYLFAGIELSWSTSMLTNEINRVLSLLVSSVLQTLAMWFCVKKQ